MNQETLIKNPYFNTLAFLLFAAVGALFVVGAIYTLMGMGGIFLALLTESIPTIFYLMATEAGYAGALLGAIIYISAFSRQKIKYIRFEKTISARGLRDGAFYAAAVLLPGIAILEISGVLENIRFTGLFSSLPYYVFLLLLISFTEELIFRAFIIPELGKKLPKAAIIAASSILFAAVHAGNANINILAFINIFLAGVFLGLLFLKSKNIWPAFSFHFFWNFIEGPLLGFRVSGGRFDSILKFNPGPPEFLSGGLFGFEASILCSIGLAALIFVIFNKKNPKADSFKP